VLPKIKRCGQLRIAEWHGLRAASGVRIKKLLKAHGVQEAVYKDRCASHGAYEFMR